MKFLQNITKSIKAHHLLILGVIVAFIALSVYSSNKSKVTDKMTTHHQVGGQATNGAHTNNGAHHQGNTGVMPSAPLGDNEEYAQVQGIQSRDSGLSNCSKQAMQDPSSLLPKDENNDWARLNPSGNGKLESVNLLNAGYHIGIDTVGNTLRNANLQVRSEPANPQTSVGPWNNTTINPDMMRTPLELGCGPQ